MPRVNSQHACVECANRQFKLAIVVLLFLFTPLRGYCDNLTDAVTAYHAGQYQAAATLLIPLAESGNASAQSFLGRMYLLGLGMKQDDELAYRHLLAAAEQGDADAQFHLAEMYVYGSATAPPSTSWDHEAARWCVAAAVQDHAAAEYMLGLLLIAGTGVTQNVDEGREWIAKAAEQGHPEARRFISSYVEN